MKAIAVTNLSKSYGNLRALSQLSFEVEQGEIYGVIGADGAGKTTLFRILTTLLLADEGVAQVEGVDVVANYREIRKIIGYMPGKFSLYQDLSVEENLSFFATLFHTTIEENYHLIEDIYKQIEPFKKRRAGALSGGMKQKLALSCALIHKPKVLFLDEPTTGVDPVSRKEFWEMLFKLKQQGITIFVSTPYMDEATRCDRIALMKEGHFLKVDTPAAIIKSYPHALWAIQSAQMHQLLNDLRHFPEVATSYSFGACYHVTFRHSTTPLKSSQERFWPDALQHYLIEKGHTSLAITPIEPSIEDCFMQLSTSSSL